jgi:hypothetical protein
VPEERIERQDAGDGAVPFDGEYLWYKVVTTFPNTKVYQIRIDGVIIGIYT